MCGPYGACGSRGGKSEGEAQREGDGVTAADTAPRASEAACLCCAPVPVPVPVPVLVLVPVVHIELDPVASWSAISLATSGMKLNDSRMRRFRLVTGSSRSAGMDVK